MFIMSKKSLLIGLLSITCIMSSASDTNDRDYWVSRFLSVSYPLKKVRQTSPYGYRIDPLTKKKTFHSGIDLKANYEDVYSLFGGVVTAVGSDNRSGNYIVLRYGVYQVSFCHLSKRYVSKGDSVYAGEPIAVSGNTGRSSGPHLHLTVRLNGKTVNPNTILSVVDKIKSESIEAITGKKQAYISAGREFFSYFAELAMEQQRKYGIPASVTLSQMAHESDFGTSKLAMRDNNYFGIKCSSSWLKEGKPYSIHDDDRAGEKFCVYGSIAESIEHHSRILTSTRYKKYCNFSPTDYRRWLRGIKKAGYATSPSYVEKCEKLIKQYKLYYYDILAQKV